MAIDTDIQNYYETLVVAEIQKLVSEGMVTGEEANDIACLALNNLPAKYYRHSVDLAFYLEPEEVRQMKEKVAEQTALAVGFIRQQRST